MYIARFMLASRFNLISLKMSRSPKVGHVLSPRGASSPPSIWPSTNLTPNVARKSACRLYTNKHITDVVGQWQQQNSKKGDPAGGISERDRRKIHKMQRKMNENMVREINRERSHEMQEQT
jgi:hypothetical protein